MDNLKRQDLLVDRDRHNLRVRPKQFFLWLKYLSLFFLCLGILVRLIQYINNRSLWDDEAAIALNIVNLSYLELLNSLENNQAAPPGFLWIVKLSTQILGNNEYALRLFPFLCSLVSLFAFYRLANRYTSVLAAPVAIALFACLQYPLYYATEAKQYSSDMMVTLLLILLLFPLRERILGARQILFLSLLGAAFIWLSHTAIFPLSGLELSTLLTTPARKRLPMIGNRLPIYLTWLLSFALLFFLSISSSMENSTLQDSWGPSYPDSLFDVIWLLDAFGRFFYNPLGFVGFTDGVACFAFVCGCFAYYRTNRKTLLFLMSPIFTTLIASYLHKYPFRDRLLLFLAPVGIAIVAQGIVFLLAQYRKKYRYVTIVGILVLAISVAPPLLHASQLIISPELKEEIRPAFAFVKSHQQPGDRFYVYPTAKNAFTYYANKYGYSPGDYTIGERLLPFDGKGTQQEWEEYQRDIEALLDKQRVWLLYRAKEKRLPEISSYLNRIGQQLDFFYQPGIFVYLYDFNSSPSPLGTSNDTNPNQ